jgi:hypothetical protein
VAALGRSLALAWRPAAAYYEDPKLELRVRVIAESGATVGETVLTDVEPSSRISLAASPSEDSLLVTWRDRDPAGRIRLARVDCVGGAP